MEEIAQDGADKVQQMNRFFFVTTRRGLLKPDHETNILAPQGRGYFHSKPPPPNWRIYAISLLDQHNKLHPLLKIVGKVQNLANRLIKCLGVTAQCQSAASKAGGKMLCIRVGIHGTISSPRIM